MSKQEITNILAILEKYNIGINEYVYIKNILLANEKKEEVKA